MCSLLTLHGCLQAASSWCNKLLEDNETGSLDEEGREEACAAAGGNGADVSWQAWPSQHR